MKEKNRKIKIYVYGAGFEYNRFLSYVSAYSDKVEIIGIVTTESQPIKFLDGYPCITAEEMRLDLVDYIVIAIAKWEEIISDLKALGVEGKKIIPSVVFSLPYFEFDSYFTLREKRNVSIISNSCLGGFIYHSLGMEYTSPTIYLACEGDMYLSFLENLEYYLAQEMKVSTKKHEYSKEIYYMSSDVPRGILGDEIEWGFYHHTDVELSVQKWNERKKRCNLEELVVLMVIYTEEQAKRFEQLPYKRKLGIYHKDLQLKSVVYCKEWNELENRLKYDYQWIRFTSDYMCGSHGQTGKVDWLKFLLGKEEFIRF